MLGDKGHMSPKPHDMTHLISLIPMLTRRARRLARSRPDAEDLVQDTLVSLCARLRRGGPIDDLPAYAMRSLGHRAYRQAGQHRPTAPLEDDMIWHSGTTALRLDCADTLRAIDTLPKAQRQLMQHLIAGETSPRAIARATGLPMGTVMSRLARARAQLRILLDR